MARPPASVFPTVRSEGGLLPPDLLQRIVEADAELGGFAPSDYGLAEREPVREAIARAWQRVRAYWAAFQAATEDLPPTASGVSETREQWVLPLLRTMGFGDLEFRAAAEEVGERRYAISHRAGGIVSVHVASLREDLDRSTRAGDGAARLSPHGLVQEYLNRSEGHLYGLVTNGLLLRLLRDNYSLTRLAYVEFDLKAMLDGGVYADFVLLWLALHRSRLPQPGVSARQCWLEQWRERAETQGARAMGELRGGVEKALVALGTGLLAHPANDRLRERLRSGDLTTQDFYAQLLRLLYRMLFLFVAEERDLLFPPGASEQDRRRYAGYYGLSRLRDLARRHADDERHDDLWRGLQLTFDVLAGRREGLGLPVLGGGLFSPEVCPDIDGQADTPAALMSNAALAQAVLNLSVVRVSKRWRRVNYRDLDTEELGGVYEGLLERQPRVVVDVANPHFELVGSGERKQTGSFYTPSSLVDELIKSALDPVLADRLATARTAQERERALLGITVCDTATGSGHFLLAAARRIAGELARVRAGEREPSPTDLRQALRDVIRHCVYGVDLNPLAVDLCRLSLWLEGHDAGRPLTFLDHRVKVGNSLVGATPDLVAVGIPDGAFEPVGDDEKSVASRWKKLNKQQREALTKEGERQATFLGGGGGVRADWARLAGSLAEESRAIGDLPEDAPRQVAEQRAQYETYRREKVDPARAALDAWTAAFFWPLRAYAVPPVTSADLHVLPGESPSLSAEQWGEVERLRTELHFFHWPLEFPEVFDRGGFDCVLGNPPWDKVEMDEPEFFAQRDPSIAKLPGARRKAAIERLTQTNPPLWREFADASRRVASLTRFVKESERFSLTGSGRINLYALFAEQDRRVLGPRGRAGVIVPTGIATDDSTKAFFQDVVERGSLATLFDFENRKVFFEDVHASYKFALLTLSGAPVERGDLAFFLTNTDHLRDERRRFQLSAEDFALLNPNTRTCPVFRTRADADLTRAIYRRVPVLVDERAGLNPWGVEFMQGLFNMTSDSGLFRDAPGPGLVPLYEAKLFHQFNHRWATYDGADARDATLAELADPAWHVRPRYWVEQHEVYARLEGRWDRGWLLAFRNIARATDERTALFSVIPRLGVGHSAPVMFPTLSVATEAAALVGNVAALTFDYVVRQKLGGVNMTFGYIHQFAVLPPSAYTPADLDFIVPRVLELTYTAWDLKPFAEDLGYDGPPFRWDEERRAVLRAELDAYYAALYGLTRDELRYVLDPADLYGPDFPGETFRVLKERETKQHGEYRTRRLVLEAWDRLGLAPRNRDGRYVAGGSTSAQAGASPMYAVTEPSRSGTDGAPISAVGDSALAASSGQSAQAPRPGGEAPLLVAQTVRQRVRAPGRTVPLLPLDSDRLDAPAALRAASAGPFDVARPPVPLEAQGTLPIFSPEVSELRARVLSRALDTLKGAGPLTGREIAQRLLQLDSRVDRHLVNSVLTREGAPHVRHDPATGKYRAVSRHG